MAFKLSLKQRYSNLNKYVSFKNIRKDQKITAQLNIFI